MINNSAVINLVPSMICIFTIFVLGKNHESRVLPAIYEPVVKSLRSKNHLTQISSIDVFQENICELPVISSRLAIELSLANLP